MKRYFLFLLLLITVSVAYGQQQSICEHLRATGRVNLQQDSRLTALVGTNPKVYYANAAQTGSDEPTQVMGFRIRVFSGNQQVASRNRCYSIQTSINEKLPELPTYVTFKTPNWRISVGDYRTNEEALSALSSLKALFPAYAGEMFVVKEKINL